MNSIMIPSISLISQIVSHLSKSPARFPFGQNLQLLPYFTISGLFCLVAISRSADIQQITGLSFAEIVFHHSILCQFAALSNCYSFFSIISFSTVSSRLRSAYICFNFRFSSSSSFNRLREEASMPPYLAFHL